METLSILTRLVKTFKKYDYRCDITCAHTSKEDTNYLKFVMNTLRISKDDSCLGYIDIRGQKYSLLRGDDKKYPQVSSLEVFDCSMTSKFKSPNHYYNLTDDEINKELIKIIKMFMEIREEKK